LSSRACLAVRLHSTVSQSLPRVGGGGGGGGGGCSISNSAGKSLHLQAQQMACRRGGVELGAIATGQELGQSTVESGRRCLRYDLSMASSIALRCACRRRLKARAKASSRHGHDVVAQSLAGFIAENIVRLRAMMRAGSPSQFTASTGRRNIVSAGNRKPSKAQSAGEGYLHNRIDAQFSKQKVPGRRVVS